MKADESEGYNFENETNRLLVQLIYMFYLTVYNTQEIVLKHLSSK